MYIIRILGYIVTSNTSLASEKTVHACMYMCWHVCMHVCVWVAFACLLSCLFVCVFCLFVYVCRYVCMHSCMHACRWSLDLAQASLMPPNPEPRSKHARLDLVPTRTAKVEKQGSTPERHNILISICPQGWGGGGWRVRRVVWLRGGHGHKPYPSNKTWGVFLFLFTLTCTQYFKTYTQAY